MPLAATFDSLTLGVLFAVCAVCAALGVWRWGMNWSASHRDLTRAARAESREQRLVRREFESLLDRMEKCALDLDRRADEACRRIQSLISAADKIVACSRPNATMNCDSARKNTSHADHLPAAAMDGSTSAAQVSSTDESLPLAVASAPVARVSLSSRIDRLRRKIRGVSLPGAPIAPSARLRTTALTPGGTTGVVSNTNGIEAPPIESRSPGESNPTMVSQTPQSSAPIPTNPDPRFSRLYELADSGLATRRIANELSMPLGEVELILNLRTIAH